MNILKSISETLSRALAWIKNALTIGTDIGNQIKAIVDSPYVEGIVALTGTKLDDKALTFLKAAIAIWLKDAKIVSADVTDADEAIKQGSIAISQMTTARATTLSGLSAYASTVVAKLNGNDLPIEQALSGVQVAYFHPQSLV
ncbi:MAG: hypothetical protein ABIN91_11195 [Mucilaginibacter sp.]|uniref:hypothetical protein n=1 Tax=Mucilaginibacter sp. TaxID=1882438 RepID=UPI0032676FC4